MRLQLALRAAAVSIAVAGLADPVLTRATAVRQQLAIVSVGTPDPAPAQALHTALGDDYDVTAHVHSSDGTAAACPGAGGCVIVSDGAVPRRVTSGAAVIGALLAPRPPTADVLIAGVEPAAPAHVDASSTLRVHLRRLRAGGVSRVDVFDGDALVGQGVHEWAARTNDGPADATVDVIWVPLGAGARQLRVAVGQGERADATVAHQTDLGVDVRAAPWPVVMHEPETTWLGTFVRRALEDDSRVALHGRTLVSPRISVARGDARPLTRDALRRIGVVVVTAPHALSTAEVDLLDRFVRVRGGSVVLLPDRRPSGPVLRLLPPIVEERREAEPQPVGPLRARERLFFDRAAPGVSVLLAADDGAVLVARASGRGRVIVSGALDAWRYRGVDTQFARFWRSVVADAAAAAGEPVGVDVQTPLVAAGSEARLRVDWRTLDDVPDRVGIRGTYQCADHAGVVRLWPGARRGTFEGSLQTPAAGTCAIAVTIDGVSDTGRGVVAVRSEIRRPVPDGRALEGAIAAHGGSVVTSGDTRPVIAAVHARMPVGREPRPTKPMRSPWWIVPLAACLGGEWWLRRKQGLR